MRCLKATLEIGAGISGGVPREFKGLLGHSLNPDPFFADKQRKDAGFVVQMPQGKVAFSALEDAAIRDLREYSIPTIEITLNDESTLDDMISLFVDINQYGVRVNRFDIVKAMGRTDPLLLDVFGGVRALARLELGVFSDARIEPVAQFLRLLLKMRIGGPGQYATGTCRRG